AVKGAARVANVPAVEEACHALESLFARMRDGEKQLDGATFELLFGAVDALADAHDRLRDHRTLDDSPLAAILPRLHAVTQEAAHAFSPPPLPPAAARPPAGPPPQPPPAAPPPAPEPPAAAATLPAEDTVRVRADKLDAVALHSGELLVAA